MSSIRLPDRIVDTRNQGWLARGDGMYEGYDPTTATAARRLEPRPIAAVEAEFGRWRPVAPPDDAEVGELRAAFEMAGRKAAGSVASALDEVHNEARNRFGPWDADGAATAAYAQRTLTAGRPGSWEADAIMEVVYFGNALNLHHRKGASSVEDMRSKGPSPKRVHLEARDRIATVLRAWTASDDRYTEVPETLAQLLSQFADERHGPDGWHAIADQWLQASSMDQENFRATYRLLYSLSVHFGASVL